MDASSLQGRSVCASVASAIPIDGIAGGIGFLVLIPSALAALVAVPIGLYYSIELWKDGVLPLLSILTMLMIAEFVTEAGSVDFYNATGLVYGILVLMLEASWFLFRRGRTFPT